MVHTDTTTSNPAAAAAAGGAMRSSGNSNSNSNSNTVSNTRNNNANVSSNPNSPRIRSGNMNPMNMNMNLANMNMNMNMNRNHLNNTVPMSGPIPNYSAMSVLQQQQLNMNMNMNMNMHTNHSAAGQVPTRFLLTPNSIPPSPPFHPNNHTTHSHTTPFVPNLNIAPPGSPNPNDYDYGDDRADPAFGSSSPYMRATKSAVDTALANERDRIKSLELQEEESFAASATGTVSVEQFKMALKRERQYSKRLVGELAALKSVAVTSTLEAEINEEGRINCLMRRLDILQKEKGRIIVELEREEEMLTNTLQKKLNEVRREKAELERQIEKEHMLKARLESIHGNAGNGNDNGNGSGGAHDVAMS